MAKSPDEKPSHTVLMSCAGLGMGNASRMAAVIEALHEYSQNNGGHRLDLHVVSWGSGLRFLEEYRRTHKGLEFQLIEAQAYTAGLIGYAFTYVKNVVALFRAVKELQPNLIVLDSDYHFPAYLKSGCPVVFIGQAEDVLRRARQDSYLPESLTEKLNLVFREKLDSWVQKIFSDVVLVPSFNQFTGKDKKIRQIPLIVRREFLEKPQVSNKQTVGLLLSGSKQEKESFLHLAAEHGLKVFSPDASSERKLAICKATDIDEFEIVFIQGGLSSISECIARRKFTVVFPMKGHAEQQLNARQVEKLGLGIKSDLAELEQFADLLSRATTKKLASPSPAVSCGGAQAAAEILMNQLLAARPSVRELAP